jgi:hypothetical protein
MKYGEKTVLIIPNSTVFLKLAILFIDKSKKTRNKFFVIAENGLPNLLTIKKRIQKVGILHALDEWLYCKYESIFNHWEKAENHYLSEIDIRNFLPDFITDTVNKNNNDLILKLQFFSGNNILSIGSGYIPKSILDLFDCKLNIHPGILPFYKGIGTPEALMKKDYSNLGWSIHELSSKIDNGKIIHIKNLWFSEFEYMTFADAYIYIYINSINEFFKIADLNIEFNENNESIKFNSFMKLSDYILAGLSFMNWKIIHRKLQSFFFYFH